MIQAALEDFYVRYVLMVCLEQQDRKALLLHQLHANIQDLFNEYGVQIMSPNYEADPAGAEGRVEEGLVRGAGGSAGRPAGRSSTWSRAVGRLDRVVRGNRHAGRDVVPAPGLRFDEQLTVDQVEPFAHVNQAKTTAPDGAFRIESDPVVRHL